MSPQRHAHAFRLGTGGVFGQTSALGLAAASRLDDDGGKVKQKIIAWDMSLSDHIAWVYILTNEATTVLYTGYTTALNTRLWEHRTK